MGRLIKMPALAEKLIVSETREQKLARARKLSASITNKAIAAGITHQELEENAYRAFLKVCKNRESNNTGNN